VVEKGLKEKVKRDRREANEGAKNGSRRGEDDVVGSRRTENHCFSSSKKKESK
jgi:hypothetical protein